MSRTECGDVPCVFCRDSLGLNKGYFKLTAEEKTNELLSHINKIDNLWKGVGNSENFLMFHIRYINNEAFYLPKERARQYLLEQRLIFGTTPEGREQYAELYRRMKHLLP